MQRNGLPTVAAGRHEMVLIDTASAVDTRAMSITRLRDRLAAERRALPWVRVEKSYVSQTACWMIAGGKRWRGRRFQPSSQLTPASLPGYPVTLTKP